MPGVKIVDGSVISAGDVDAKDIPPYKIWGANPVYKFVFNGIVFKGSLDTLSELGHEA